MESLRNLLQDLLLAWRRLARTPRSSMAAALVLALALGSHLAIAGLIDSVFLRPLDVFEPDRLVAVSETRDGRAFLPLAFSDYVHYRAESRAFSELAAHYPSAPLHLDLGEIAEMVNGAVVTANYFPVLGLEPALGRFFRAEEDLTPGTHPVAVISHRLWRERLGGGDGVLGGTITVKGTPLTVVGVAPAGFAGLAPDLPSQIWLPSAMAATGYRWCDALGDRSCRIFRMVGRLAPGADEETACLEMAHLGSVRNQAHPEDGPIERGLHSAPLAGHRSELGQQKRATATLLVAVVTLVVLVAGVNLAGILIGRSLRRRKEIAVRLALGAPRGRILSLFIGEALLLAAAGGAGGLLVAAWASPLLGTVFRTRGPLPVELGGPVLGYAAVLSALIGIAVGAVPGIQASRPSQIPALKDVVSVGARRPRLLSLFVVLQIGVSFVLLSSVGSLGQSLANLRSAGGVDPAEVLTLRLRPRLAGYTPEQGQAVVAEAVRRIEALPGIRSVGFGQLLPIWPGFDAAVGLPGGAGDPGASADPSTGPVAKVQPIGPRSLETLGIPLARGREFDARDRPGSPRVALVNPTLARVLWPGGEAVGQEILIGGEPHRVVGVARDSGYLDLLHDSAPRAFTAYWQDPTRVDARIVVRTDGLAEPRIQELRRLVYELDPAVPVTETWTLAHRLRNDLADFRIAGGLVAVAGALAVVLGAFGLSGVLALLVAQRVREIGIRRALGATPGKVVGLVVRDALSLVAVALVAGGLAALASAPLVTHLLYGVSAHGPGALAGAALAVLAVAFFASWWPAKRAARIDPIEALRSRS